MDHKSSDQNTAPIIVGIRFSTIGKSYYFDASSINNLKLGDSLVVETSRGWQLGKLVQFVNENEINKKMRYKPVDRLATNDDIDRKKYLDEKGCKALEFTQKLLTTKEFSGVKLIYAEFSFDERTLSYLFSTEEEKQINFNPIVGKIKEKFNIRKIDFHKIGPRDAAKFFGGMGACGLEVRCCARFLSKFESISIRMAKTQGISLTPSDITGMCNRLRCCLNYEYCQYTEALKNMPKKNTMVTTPMGIGKVKDIAPLKNSVFVAVEGHTLKEFYLDEIEKIQSNQKLKNSIQKKEKDSKKRRQRHERNKKDSFKRRRTK
jgi:cell fate regulator YaaT (PSP1 superfamily)